MKILFVDTSVKGHHRPYLSALASENGEDNSYFFIPERLSDVPKERQFIFHKDLKKINEYLSWLNEVKSVVDNIKPDCIHFLYGDIFYRFFGLGLKKLADYKVIITFHHIRYGKLHEVSLKHIFHNISNGVVHTEHLSRYLIKIGVNNVTHIEYPVFEKIEIYTKDKIALVKEKYKVPQNTTVLLALGGTRVDKGLDILLESLKNVRKPFALIIAGKEQDITEQQINAMSKSYSDSVIKILRFLTDTEIEEMLNISDIVVLPYRKIFDGASGPLGLAVMSNTFIIGPNHGSLGNIITQHHLGRCFEVENASSLGSVIEETLESSLLIDEVYKNYESELSLDNFLEKYSILYTTKSSKIKRSNYAK